MANYVRGGQVSVFVPLLLLFGAHGAPEEPLRSTGELRKACSKRGAIKQPPSRINTTGRLLAIRKAMQRETIVRDRRIDAYYVTTDDEHQSEYTSPYDRRLEYISGFSGSYGEAIIGINSAALWTDGRYHLQADDQLNCDWLLMREGQKQVPTKGEWLRRNLKPNSRIGADPRLIAASAWEALRLELEESTLVLVELSVNLVDHIWKDHKDTIADKNAFVWDTKYAGKNWTTKVDETRLEVQNAGANAMVVSSLSEIAWLLNIRGRDTPYSLYLKSYVILTATEVYLYTNRTKLLKNDVTRHLNSEHGLNSYAVRVKHYEEIWRDLSTLSQSWNKVIVPSLCVYSRGASKAIYNLVSEEKRLSMASPIIYLKATKNPVENVGMENAHIRDGAAMCLFMSYLETWFENNGNYTELDVVKEVDSFRFEQSLSLGNSFPTIAAFGSNGALPHYQPSVSTNTPIFDNSTLVVDSGGQYYDGTTDVTRTLHLGNPSTEEMNAYTRVLMGSIQLSLLVFPANMRMSVADVMARAPLWEVGLDYLHSTGHGIGTFLDVHESPIFIHYNTKHEEEVFKPGYFFSNEPGFYSEDEFGVRLENVLEVISKPWLRHLSGQPFLGFKEVTLVPYEPKLINFSLLSPFHIRWLNAYNSRIRELVGKELKEQNKMNAFYWMMEKTKYIPGSSPKLFSKVSATIIIIITIMGTVHNV